MGKLRILNTKTGEVKFREAHIANNAKLLKTYGYILQDLGSETVTVDNTNEKVKAEYEKLTASEKPVFEGLDELIEETKIEILTKEPVKKGRKPKQN
jgi:hypothetical protein